MESVKNNCSVTQEEKEILKSQVSPFLSELIEVEYVED